MMEAQNNKVLGESAVVTGWATDVGWSVIGTVLYPILQMLVQGLWGLRAALSFAFVFCLLAILYVLIVYRSLFDESRTEVTPLVSNGAVSFCNCFFGSFIFGPIWNARLTRAREDVVSRRGGASVVVFVVLVAIGLILDLISFGLLQHVFPSTVAFHDDRSGVSFQVPVFWHQGGDEYGYGTGDDGVIWGALLAMPAGWARLWPSRPAALSTMLRVERPWTR